MKKQIKEALTILNNKGYEAYLVGGAVRNYLLSSAITDYDITTNADPNAIKMCFSNYTTYDIGKELGTIVVVIDRVKIDITPYRKEGEYTNHRKPNNVTYAKQLKQDLKRRDFTINALCMDKDNNIIDLFNGIEDIQNKTIKAIGNPDARFHEDALRILRAIRFKTKLNFEIEERTNKAIFKNKDLLNYISGERKKDELLQILNHPNAYKVINEYLVVFNTFMNFNHIDRKRNNFSNPLYSLSYILSISSKHNLKQLKYSKQEIQLIDSLIYATNIDINNDYEYINCLSNIYQKDIYIYLNELHNKNFHTRFDRLKKYMISENELKIDGNAIQEYGYHGKQIKQIKNKMVDLIHHQKLTNNHSSLIKFLKNVKI